MTTNIFNNVTLLVTHYNRSKSLKHLLKRFAEEDLQFGEIIVSDDGSKAVHLDRVKELQKQYAFRLIADSANAGLGHNINKGQLASSKPFTLYVQEDFEPTARFCEVLKHAITLIDQEPWDLIRFYTFPWAPFPHLKNYKYGFSEMKFPGLLASWNHLKFRMYSDHPHLRRSTFLDKFGPYLEGTPGDITEYDMCMRFLSKGGKALIYPQNNLFLHEHNCIEPNTIKRKKWKLNNSLFIRLLRSFYLVVKVIRSTVQLEQAKTSETLHF